MDCIKNYCKDALFQAGRKRSAQCFHRCVQPFHTFFEGCLKYRNFALKRRWSATLGIAGTSSALLSLVRPLHQKAMI